MKLALKESPLEASIEKDPEPLVRVALPEFRLVIVAPDKTASRLSLTVPVMVTFELALLTCACNRTKQKVKQQRKQ